VLPRHPHKLTIERWTGGTTDFSQLQCPAPVSQVACDGLEVYCSVAGSSHVFVYTCTDTTQILQDVLQPGHGAGTIWQLQVGLNILVAITETSVLIWRKHAPRDLVARIRHSSQGEPYLHVEDDVLVVPGDSKCVCRVLLYDKYTNNISCVRDLDHKKYWVLGAHLGTLTIFTILFCSIIILRKE